MLNTAIHGQVDEEKCENLKTVLSAFLFLAKSKQKLSKTYLFCRYGKNLFLKSCMIRGDSSKSVICLYVAERYT
jgi:hypothetical protein